MCNPQSSIVTWCIVDFFATFFLFFILKFWNKSLKKITVGQFSRVISVEGFLVAAPTRVHHLRVAGVCAFIFPHSKVLVHYKSHDKGMRLKASGWFKAKGVHVSAKNLILPPEFLETFSCHT